MTATFFPFGIMRVFTNHFCHPPIMKKESFFCLVLLFCFYLPLAGQYFDKKHLSVSGRAYTGKILRPDREVRDILQDGNCMIYHLTIGYSTLPTDQSVFAPDYNYPTFGLGVSVADFSRSRMYGESHIGNIYTLYGYMNRPVVRQRYWSFGYNFEAGLSYASDPYNPVTNPGNYLVGSPIMVYVGFGVDLKCRLTDYLEIGLDMGAKHYSNGRMGMPNKGINILGGGASVCYYFGMPPLDYTKPELPPFAKHFYYHLALGGGGQASLQEWDIANDQSIPELKQTRFRLYPKASISADVMYRFSRKYGTGIGIDFFYTPHTNRLREWDNILESRSTGNTKYNPLSTGVAINHEVYYGNLAMFAGLGCYVYRQLGIRDNDSRFYQRAGFRYYFPALNNLFIGYAIKAHNFKLAEYLELSIGIKVH